MIIQIARIGAEGSTYEGEEPIELLDLQDEEEVRAEKGIQYSVFAQIISHELVVQGTLSVPLLLKCARCAEFFSTNVRDSAFLRAYPLPDQAEEVDLSEDVREAVILNIPHFALCSEDCRGLCPQCGTNLNKGPCQCSPPEEESPWGVLDKLDT